VKGKARRHDRVVAALKALHEPGLQGLTAGPGEIHRLTSAAQEPLHALRPRFLVDLDQGLELA
jgi:hypothetical protein